MARDHNKLSGVSFFPERYTLPTAGTFHDVVLVGHLVPKEGGVVSTACITLMATLKWNREATHSVTTPNPTCGLACAQPACPQDD